MTYAPNSDQKKEEAYCCRTEPTTVGLSVIIIYEVDRHSENIKKFLESYRDIVRLFLKKLKFRNEKKLTPAVYNSDPTSSWMNKKSLHPPKKTATQE